ncbi:SIS domain-containing protein, partial [Klebsiella pneumoniae]|uniref:SIS domain-containing protein n=1 Tax=Klebsiella pneumoniae TaxID=573 RepID=UPI001E304D07
FEQERQSLKHFFDTINLSDVEKIFNILKACEGMIVLSGVGKSALVAEKTALTLTSTGTRAFFLSPSNALHGDIGIVSKKDVFIMMSKSGESDELLQMIPTLRNKGVQIIAVVNNPHCRMMKACDHSICLPMVKEL